MRPTPRMAAAMIAAQPTAPAPNTASTDSGPGRKALRMAPAPVWMPQPSGASVESGASAGTFTRPRSWMRACLANVDWPKKWPWTGSPARRIVALPSGREPPKRLRVWKWRQ